MKRLLQLITLLCLTSTATFSQVTWIGAGTDNDWDNPANWDVFAIPSTTDDVIIPSGYTVVLNVFGNIKSINLQGDSVFEINTNLTFTAPSNFGPNTTVNWNSGTINGSLSSLTNQGVINLRTTSNKSISGEMTLENEGFINITSSGDLLITGSESVLHNPIEGIIDMQADTGNISWSGTPGVLSNEGLIKKTTSSGVAAIVLPINNNDGTIQVEAGTLSFQNTLGKNFTDGTYNVFAGATMDWDTTINPSGTLEGNIVGNLNWNSILNIPDGENATFNFSETDNFNWTTGTLSGGGTLINTNVLKLIGSSNKFVSGDSTLENLGTLVLTSNG
ncbi:hypothetical protein Q4512_00005, partial [Oceanihabitans sp. 2_MG-2023]|uniref:hypothetical protein n=1 Tax=Oceanihabitans sp. 2_MG-2023 TaxID=3062661 RepID=UPI0026E20BD4